MEMDLKAEGVHSFKRKKVRNDAQSHVFKCYVYKCLI